MMFSTMLKSKLQQDTERELTSLKARVHKQAIELHAAGLMDEKTLCQILGIPTQQEQNMQTIKDFLEVEDE